MKGTHFNRILSLLPTDIRECIGEISADTKSITQIRLKTGSNALVYLGSKILELNFRVEKSHIDTVISRITQYSPIRAASSFARGYASFCGARIGFWGECMEEMAPRGGFKEVSGLCIRIPHEVIGCGESVAKAVIGTGGVANTLIISPPGGGKTTLLRDIARIAGSLFACVIIDERGEICPMAQGVPTMDVGKYTDVLVGFEKKEALCMAVRNLSPRAVFTDEIGTSYDAQALFDASTMGVGFVATAHGRDFGDALKREGIRRLYDNNLITYAITLSDMAHPGKIEALKRVVPCGCT